ncbi:hypothetical protein Q6348_10585 [Isoptericola sp. b441]|uniref:Uncharacterized protein n=1 Tax=Actinotalea lenta TaxID=3064654 RepID=A0ABT9D9Q6_9CELL|nr:MULTISPECIES: hypothetical protein [unclassified Isoptericola]MDO8107642.1 hypothetical protein [Isoptericola sp. b441]
MIVLGLVFGRWWRSALVLAAVIWDVLLVADGVMGFELGLLGAALLAAANAAIGVLVHQGVLQAYRWLRRRRLRRGRVGAEV